MGLKSSFLYLLKFLGVFALIKFKNRKALRILCYQGFSIHDEHKFLSNLFVSPKRLKSRLKYFKKTGYNFLTLDRAVELKNNNQLPDNTIIFAVENGFNSTITHAMPILKELDIPITQFNTNSYSDREYPVFSLWMRYIFLKTKVKIFDFTSLGIFLAGTNKEDTLKTLIDYGEREITAKERWKLAQNLTKILNVEIPDKVYNQFLRPVPLEDLNAINPNNSGIRSITDYQFMSKIQLEAELVGINEFLKEFKGKFQAKKLSQSKSIIR